VTADRWQKVMKETMVLRPLAADNGWLLVPHIAVVLDLLPNLQCLHATPLNIDAIALIRQQHGLCRDDLKIVVYATLISFVEESKRFLGRCRGLLLLLRLLLKNAQCGKVVFDLLERGKCCRRS